MNARHPLLDVSIGFQNSRDEINGLNEVPVWGVVVGGGGIECRVDGWVIHDNSLGGPARDPSILFPVILRGGEFLIVIVHRVVAIGWVDLVLVMEFKISGVDIIFRRFDGVGQVHIVVVAWVVTVGWVYFVLSIRPI